MSKFLTKCITRHLRAPRESARLNAHVRQNGGHPGDRAAFPTLPTSPRLTAGASFALVVSQACVPTCPEYMSPCPKPFDVVAWCGDTNCQLDMQPAQCAEFLGCRARRGQKLSIPISQLSLSSAGCSGVAVAPEEFIVQLDGVAGTPSSLHYANEAGLHMGTLPGKPLPFSHSSGVRRGYDA